MAQATWENDAEARKYLAYALDPSFTQEMATTFGNDEPEPAQNAFFDHGLEGTGTYAYYCSPKEVHELYGDRHLPPSLLKDTVPYIGLNPDLLGMPPDFAYSVIDHEKGHGGQPKGKLALLGIHADTPEGTIPIGKMLVEGWNEYGLERRGKKSPSRYFDEMCGKGETAYSNFRDFVYEVEHNAPGITRQIMRASRKGGPNAAMRLIESIPDIGNIAAKYASKLNRVLAN